MNTQLRYCSKDKKLNVIINYKAQSVIEKMCRKSSNKETGGIIIGYYNEPHDSAIISAFTSPPDDSQHGNFSFFRGVHGLQSLLNKIWPRHYYIGEWHYHPYAAPSASRPDANQMIEISKAREYHCPEPILIIVGGDPNVNLEYRVYVVPHEQSKIIQLS